MKAVAAPRKGEVEAVSIEVPQYREYECLVKVHACGLCNGTDLKIIDDKLSDWTVDFPTIIGHEGVGEVVEVGDEVKYIQPGDLFANPIGRLAPGCPYSRTWGGMKEYSIVQDHRRMEELGVPDAEFDGGYTRPLPQEIDPVDATVLLTLKEAWSGLRNLGFERGMEVLVYGDGPVGLSLTTFLRLGHAGTVICVGHHDDRLARLLEIGGADETINSTEHHVPEAVGKQRFDLVVDAVGSTEVIKQGSGLLRSGGKVGVYGVLKPYDAELSLLDLQNNTSVHVLNWPVGEHDLHEDIVALVQDGTIDPGNFYSHSIPAERVREAVRMVRERVAYRVAITF